MALTLYAHPFSSYCQKVFVALYENATPFTQRLVADPGVMEELAALWPFRKFPVLVDDSRTVLESSIIIEHLQQRHPGPARLIPDDADAALETRLMDRFFDNYVSTPQGAIVFDALRPPEHRDPFGVAAAKQSLETAYAWLDKVMAARTWAIGLHHGRLRRRPLPVLRRLEPPDRSGLQERLGLPPPAAGPAVRRPGCR